MAKPQVAYLGPVGTYAHLVAQKRFGRRALLVPLPTIRDVCAFASRTSGSLGVVPIENSSGGAIYETVDILLENRPPVHILEELSLEVRLALLGHRGQRIRAVYSHFAPLDHCARWLGKHLRGVQRRAVDSTAVAAQRAAEDPSVAALGSRHLARLYNLEILHYPMQADVPNLTVFVVVGRRRRPLSSAIKTTLAVRLPNVPGSLCTFLEAFRDAGVNLSRIVSRPIRGSPRQYAFLVDVDAAPTDPRARYAFRRAARFSDRFRIIGAYPCRPPYRS